MLNNEIIMWALDQKRDLGNTQVGKLIIIIIIIMKNHNRKLLFHTCKKETKILIYLTAAYKIFRYTGAWIRKSIYLFSQT